MTDVAIIPSSIEHLDFDPENEKEPTCQLGRSHPYDPTGTRETCGRKAVFIISLSKPCGHVADIYLCQGCWNEVERVPGKQWSCRMGEPKCNAKFFVRPAVVSWKRV